MGGKKMIQKDHYINTNFYNDKKNFKYLITEFQKKRLDAYKNRF